MLFEKFIKRLLLFITILLTFLCSSAWATDYFVRDDGSDSNTGLSDAQAWQTISKVNGFSFNAGDDVYFKCDDTWSGTRLFIDWDGVSAANNTIIGAYYGSGTIGVSGNRPIIGGANYTVPAPGSWQGLIQITTSSLVGYITIQDLQIKNSGCRGIVVKWPDYITIDNVYVYRAYETGITLTHSHDSTVENCVVEQANYSWILDQSNSVTRAGISAAGPDQLDECYNVTFKYNTVIECYKEGIEMGRTARDCVMEYNTVYDSPNVDIYVDSGVRITIRYNLVYSSVAYAGEGGGIWLQTEQERIEQYPNLYPYQHSCKVYGNLVAAKEWGIKLSTNATGFYHEDELIYNNTVVDCDYNIWIDNDVGANGNEIKNNISYTITGSSNHSNNYSPTGYTWDYNNFDDAVTGNANSAHVVIGAPTLSKTSGWQSLTAGSVDGTDFKILTGSNCIDAGVDLGNDYRLGIIDNTDFTATPIVVDVASQYDYPAGSSVFDIGAWIYQAVDEEPPVAGNNNFSQDTDCIGWWELEGDATDSRGSDNLSTFGNPTYVAPNGDRGVILDGDDSLYLANLTGDVTSDLTVYAKFKFNAELTGNQICMIASEWKAGQKCWFLSVSDWTGGDTDIITFGIGSNGGATSNIVVDTSFDLVNGTVYTVAATYDNTNDDVHIYTFDSDGTSQLNTDPDGTVTPDINNENVEFNIGRDAAPDHYLTGTVYELAILTTEKTFADCEKMAQGLYGEPAISVQSAASAVSTLTTVDTISTINLTWDREPFIEGAVPYFDSNIFDGTNYLRYYYTGKYDIEPEITYWRATLTAGMRSIGGSKVKIDFKSGTTELTLPSNCTITDSQSQDADVTGLDSIDLSTNSYIEVPFPSTSPKEFTDSVDCVAYLTAGGYFIPDDYIKWIEDANTDAFDVSAYDGTSGHEINYNGQGYTVKGSQTFGDYSIIQRFIHGSTILLSDNNIIHETSVIPSGSTLQVTGNNCTILNDTIKGTLDIDESVTLENTAVPGTVSLANGKTLTANYSRFAQTEAVIETGGGSVIGGNNVFNVNDFGFTNEVGGDFTLTNESLLKNTGHDYGQVYDVMGVTIPQGMAPDIGAYEYAYEGHFYGDNETLYSDTSTTNLVPFTLPDDYDLIHEDDNNLIAVSAVQNEYAIYLWRNKNENNSDNIQAIWTGKTNLPASNQPVCLQVYDVTSGSWTTLECNTTVAADTKFTLQKTIETNVSHYYDTGNWVTFRIYQHW